MFLRIRILHPSFSVHFLILSIVLRALVARWARFVCEQVCLLNGRICGFVAVAANLLLWVLSLDRGFLAVSLEDGRVNSRFMFTALIIVPSVLHVLV